MLFAHSFEILRRMSSWTPSSVITSNKRPINFRQPLTTILQRFGDVMCHLQTRFLIQQYINFNPNSIPSMISTNALIPFDQRTESPREVSQLLIHPLVHSGAGKTEYVFEAGTCPIIDDEEGK